MMTERIAWALRAVERRSIPEPNTGCYLWLGAARGPEGHSYALVTYQRHTVKLTRMLLGLPIGRPRGMARGDELEACHTCDTSLCVNPAHLFAASHDANMKDAKRKGRNRAPSSWANRATCKRGHPITAENTYYGKNGRQCRECMRLVHRLREQATRGAPANPSECSRRGWITRRANIARQTSTERVA